MNTELKPLIWSTINPFGNSVQLKESTFNQHIVTENNRTEFSGEEKTLKQLAEHPRFISRDKEYSERVVYGNSYNLAKLGGVHWVSLVVDISVQPNDVVTAIAMRKIPKIETVNIIYDSNRTNESKI
jgi:hypothetical protein